MSDKTSDKMSVELSDNFMNGVKAFFRILLFACSILVIIFAALLGVAGNHLALGCFLPATIISLLWNSIVFWMLRWGKREPPLILRRVVDGFICFTSVALIIVFAFQNDYTGDGNLNICIPLFASLAAVMTFILILIGDGRGIRAMSKAAEESLPRGRAC
ncbi:hypothetical protein E5D57_013732 [Metarhizium anisopliae]|nr:hypothetical protein E5D57_013732 [Metarhizium anisopliae]